MARKRTSTFEDLVTLLSRLPWWASLLIGVVSWLILRPVATSPMATPASATLDDPSGIMLSQAWRVFAMFGQYLIPLLCLFGAIGSIAGRHRRKKLFNNVNSATQPGKAIDGLGWREFEHLIGEAFRRKGYSITETGGKKLHYLEVGSVGNEKWRHSTYGLMIMKAVEFRPTGTAIAITSEKIGRTFFSDMS